MKGERIMPVTSSRDTKARRISLDAAFLCFALALSYVEHLVPLSSVIPLPGFKLGFANIAVIAAAYMLSLTDAAVISLSRIAVSSILFGSPSSFVFSLSGGIMAFAAILVGKYLLTGISGWIGISVIAAACHNIGQLVAAAIMLSSAFVVWYLPMLLTAAALTGTVSGVLLMYTMPIIYKALCGVNKK